MRSRTVWFVVDPFTSSRTPLAVLCERDAVVHIEPCLLPEMEPAAKWCAEAGLDDIREAPRFDVLPDGCGPHVVLGSVHEPLRSLSQPEFDALMRIMNTPEWQAELEAALAQGRVDATQCSALHEVTMKGDERQ